MATDHVSPIVCLGGFASEATLYGGFRDTLAALSGRRVHLVDTRFYDWLPSVTKLGWLLVLNRLDDVVRRAWNESGREKLTLIGHSQGGILARLYLSPEPFLGKRFGGVRFIDNLITLGSPHLNEGGLRHGGIMSRWVQQHVPGAMFSEDVGYTSVAGKYTHGNASGSLAERVAFGVYKDICGNGDVWGDGIVPVRAALLPGARHTVLEDVSHFSVFGKPWYGSNEAVLQWYRPPV